MKRQSSAERFANVAALGLVVMAVWTLVIKFVAPVLYFLSSDGDGTLPIMWDFWWVAHLWLAWLLWKRSGLTWLAGFWIALVEIIIVVTKFILYALEPDTSFWMLLWFTNKVYVLFYFVVFLHFLMTRELRSALSRKGF